VKNQGLKFSEGKRKGKMGKTNNSDWKTDTKKDEGEGLKNGKGLR